MRNISMTLVRQNVFKDSLFTPVTISCSSVDKIIGSVCFFAILIAFSTAECVSKKMYATQNPCTACPGKIFVPVVFGSMILGFF